MKKTRKHTERGGKFQAIAAGYEPLKSPLAPLYGAAADHYQECDPPIRHHGDAEEANLGAGRATQLRRL